MRAPIRAPGLALTFAAATRANPPEEYTRMRSDPIVSGTRTKSDSSRLRSTFAFAISS